jgi:glyoxylase-like metal-dependent hydrolase (beta-lactamase superfamily II)
MQSRRAFMKSFLRAAATLTLADKSADASAQKAALTTAQFRESGANAKLVIHPLRNSASMISGSGGNVLVLPGPEGKLVVDSGLATSRVQMSKALDSLSADPLRFLLNTHWHFDHTDGNKWIHEAGRPFLPRKTR